MSWTIEELHQRVQEPLGGSSWPRESTIKVLSLGPDGTGGLVMEIAVERGQSNTARRQRWRLVFEGMLTDISKRPLDTAGLILRANLEEWWDTGAAEDGPGITARRLS